MVTIVYFVHLGKDCQAVFRRDDVNLNNFLIALESDGVQHARIDLDEKGEVVNG